MSFFDSLKTGRVSSTAIWLTILRRGRVQTNGALRKAGGNSHHPPRGNLRRMKIHATGSGHFLKRRLHTNLKFLRSRYCTFDLNSPTPNWGQIHQDFWWVNQPILWLQGLVYQVNY